MAALFAFAAGLVFGIGLIVAGMSNPAKVQGFLDVAGKWDPTLAVVMVTAIPVAAIAYAFVHRRNATLTHCALQLPTATAIDRPLVAGAVIFGIGWGLAGLCPAPGLVALGAGYGKGAAFVAAMVAGMAIYDIVQRMRAAPLSTLGGDA